MSLTVGEYSTDRRFFQSLMTINIEIFAFFTWESGQKSPLVPTSPAPADLMHRESRHENNAGERDGFMVILLQVGELASPMGFEPMLPG